MFRFYCSLMLLFFAGSLALTQDAKDAKTPNMFPLAKGTQWHYEVIANGQTIQVVQEVTEHSKEGEKTKAKLAATINGQEMSEEISADDKGIYRHSFNNMKLDKPLTVFKFPIQAQKWSETITLGGMEMDAKMEMKAAVNVSVGAGDYKNVIPVEVIMSVQGQEIVVTNYYAPDAGIVKQEMNLAGTKITLELKKFVKGDK